MSRNVSPLLAQPVLILTVDLVGPNAVRTGQKVYVSDQAIIFGAWGAKPEQLEPTRQREVSLRLILAESDVLSSLIGQSDTQRELTLLAHTAMFGADPSKDNTLHKRSEVHLAHDPTNPFGCKTKHDEKFFDNEIVVVHRGKSYTAGYEQFLTHYRV
jgi:hypothetical protein